jgi:hypothetical protein
VVFRIVSAAAVWLLLFGFGCTLDTTPRLSDSARRSSLGSGIPKRTDMKLDEGMFGPRATPILPVEPMTVGGLSCGGSACPFTAPPAEPCCTTPQDVARGAARAANRCGVDFSATSGAFFGNACWQRDQAGVLDARCAPLPLQPGASEPGCCTDEGRCGGRNTGQGLGCHYELDGERVQCGKEDVVPQVDCDPLGVFGIRAEVDMAWGGRSGGLVGLTDDGRAHMFVHLRVVIDSLVNGVELHGMVTPCNVELPAFYSTLLCESYKPIFPVEIWESASLPSIPVSGRYGCLHPGCLLTINPQTVLLGIDLMNPEAPWPTAEQTPKLTCSAGMGEQCFLDHDDDSLPGTTVRVKMDGTAPGDCMGRPFLYKGAPLSASLGAIFGGVRRADRILLGTRTKLGGASKLSQDCNTGVGEGFAEFVQSRAWGCLAQPGSANPGEPPAGANEPCAAPEAMFMDENLPIYEILRLGEAPMSNLVVTDRSPSKGPLMSMVRLGKLGDPISCEQVRNAVYP